MKYFFKRLTLGLVALVSMFMFTAAPMTVLAADPNANAVCNGTSIVGGDCSKAADKKVNQLLTNIVNLISWLVGFIAVFMLILGGLWYVTANGNPEKATKAQKTILYALVGLVVAGASQIIVRFIIGNFF